MAHLSWVCDIHVHVFLGMYSVQVCNFALSYTQEDVSNYVTRIFPDYS